MTVKRIGSQLQAVTSINTSDPTMIQEHFVLENAMSAFISASYKSASF